MKKGIINNNYTATELDTYDEYDQNGGGVTSFVSNLFNFGKTKTVSEVSQRKPDKPVNRNSNGLEKDYETALKEKDIKGIEKVLSERSDFVFASFSNGRTILHYLSDINTNEGNMFLQTLLKKYGRDERKKIKFIDVQDLDGNTALHVAAIAKNFDACDILMNNNANAKIKNKEGKWITVVEDNSSETSDKYSETENVIKSDTGSKVAVNSNPSDTISSTSVIPGQFSSTSNKSKSASIIQNKQNTDTDKDGEFKSVNLDLDSTEDNDNVDTQTQIMKTLKKQADKEVTQVKPVTNMASYDTDASMSGNGKYSNVVEYKNKPLIGKGDIIQQKINDLKNLLNNVLPQSKPTVQENISTILEDVKKILVEIINNRPRSINDVHSSLNDVVNKIGSTVNKSTLDDVINTIKSDANIKTYEDVVRKCERTKRAVVFITTLYGLAFYDKIKKFIKKVRQHEIYKKTNDTTSSILTSTEKMVDRLFNKLNTVEKSKSIKDQLEEYLSNIKRNTEKLPSSVGEVGEFVKSLSDSGIPKEKIMNVLNYIKEILMNYNDLPAKIREYFDNSDSKIESDKAVKTVEKPVVAQPDPVSPKTSEVLDTPSDANTEEIVNGLLKGGAKKGKKKNKKESKKSKKSKISGVRRVISRSANVHEIERYISRQNDDLHNKVIKKIMEIMEVDEDVARTYKSGLWDMLKNKTGEAEWNKLSPITKSIRLDEATTKDILKKIDLKEAKKIRQTNSERGKSKQKGGDSDLDGSDSEYDDLDDVENSNSDTENTPGVDDDDESETDAMDFDSDEVEETDSEDSQNGGVGYSSSEMEYSDSIESEWM